MADELVERYKRLNQDLTKMERDLEELKLRRAMAAGALFARDGKGHVYDLGDGVPMLIVQSKNKTHFFTPKDKFRKKGERKPKKAATKADRAHFEEVGRAKDSPFEHVTHGPNGTVSEPVVVPSRPEETEVDPLAAALAEIGRRV